MSRLLAVLAIVALTVGPGCGDDDDDSANPDASTTDAGTPDAEPGPTLDDICNATDGLYVDLFGEVFTCNADLFAVLLGTTPPTASELSELCFGALGPYLADGTVLLGDQAAFDACRAYIDGLTCEEVEFDEPTPCDDVLEGTVAIGGDCDDGEQCAGSAYCDGGGNAALTFAGGATCGTCTATKANGTTCADHYECTNGYCKEGSPQSSCATRGGTGAACDASEDCLGTRVCDPGTNLCATEPTWAVGTPCSSFPFDCDALSSNLMCHPGTGVCTAWLNLGETCDPMMSAPAYCRIFENHTCQNPGGGFQCVAPTVVGVGQSCGFFTGNECGAGLRCSDAGTCATIVALDGNCNVADTQCDFLLQCINGVCQYGNYTGVCPAP